MKNEEKSRRAKSGKASDERGASPDAVSEAEERFRVAVEAAPNGMMMVDRDGRIALVNSQIEKIFGYKRDELLGRKVEMLVPERYRPSHEGDRAVFFGDPRPRPMGAGRDLFGRRKDGSEVPIEIGLGPVGKGGEIFVLASVIDITERKRAEEDLRRLNERRAVFTSIVSHELRTPLQSIKEGIDIVLDGIDGPVTEEQKDTLGISKSNVDRLARLIDNVLDYSKLEAGRMKMEFAKTDLNKLVEEIYLLMKVEVGRKGVDFFIELPPEPVFAVVDGDKIRQVLINLVHNAVKFTEEGKISVRLTQTRNAVHLGVHDTGSGIRPEDQATIFDMYGQAPDTQTFKSGGSGIGLAVCKLVVDQHGGQIRLESAPGKGSQFTITLPQRT